MGEQRDFYETALEERFNQMEQFEAECIELRSRLKDDGGKSMGGAAKEREEWKRKWEQRELEIGERAE